MPPYHCGRLNTRPCRYFYPSQCFLHASAGVLTMPFFFAASLAPVAAVLCRCRCCWHCPCCCRFRFRAALQLPLTPPYRCRYRGGSYTLPLLLPHPLPFCRCLSEPVAAPPANAATLWPLTCGCRSRIPSATDSAL